MAYVLTQGLIDTINNASQANQLAQLGTKLDEVLGGVVAAGSISVSELASGISTTVAVDDAKTTSREENVAGLASAIVLVNSLKTILNAHAADVGEHTTAIDNVNFPVAVADATDLASVITLTTALMAKYVLHDDDAELGAAWAFHAAQEAGDRSLASVVPPTDLQTSLARLNDLKAKFNAHDADGTAHGTDTQHQVATADVAYGAAIKVVNSAVQAGDTVQWSILNDGTGNVTGVSAVAGAGFITFTFSGDPQNDAIISYTVYRAS